MRTALRILAWIVLVVAGLATPLFALVAIDNDGDPDLIIGGVVLALLAAAIGIGAFFLQRGLGREPASPETADEEPEERLARAARGDTVELRPSRLKWALVLLACVMCTIILLAYAIVDPGVLSVGGTLLFAVGGVAAACSLLPGGAYLRISPEGMLVKLPFRTRRYAWNDIENFRVFEVRSRHHTSEFVGFDLRDRTPERQSVWQTINRGVSGVDVGLPDNYGIDPHELAVTLGRLRTEHATEHGPSASAVADRRLAEQAAQVDTSRRVAVTWVVAAACVAIYAWQSSRYDLAPSPGQLVELGGATREAEWWSLLAGNLLHANVFHIVLNLIAWAIAGYLLEREIGTPRMLALCVIGGVCSMGLAVILSPDAVTVGLSGVVFAALACGVVRDPHRMRALGQAAWAMLPLGVIYTFLTPGTSIGGHLGGLGAGLLLGWYTSRS